MQKEEAALSELARIIATDPALTGKMLQIANSGFYTLRSEVTNIDRALSVLGTNIIKNIVNKVKKLSAQAISLPVMVVKNLLLYFSKQISLGAKYLLLLTADRGLYMSKENGRNQVTILATENTSSI